jgi:hypothetical protein
MNAPFIGSAGGRAGMLRICNVLDELESVKYGADKKPLKVHLTVGQGLIDMGRSQADALIVKKGIHVLKQGRVFHGPSSSPTENWEVLLYGLVVGFIHLHSLGSDDMSDDKDIVLLTASIDQSLCGESLAERLELYLRQNIA